MKYSVVFIKNKFALCLVLIFLGFASQVSAATGEVKILRNGITISVPQGWHELSEEEILSGFGETRTSIIAGESVLAYQQDGKQVAKISFRPGAIDRMISNPNLPSQIIDRKTLFEFIVQNKEDYLRGFEKDIQSYLLLVNANNQQATWRKANESIIFSCSYEYETTGGNAGNFYGQSITAYSMQNMVNIAATCDLEQRKTFEPIFQDIIDSMVLPAEYSISEASTSRRITLVNGVSVLLTEDWNIVNLGNEDSIKREYEGSGYDPNNLVKLVLVKDGAPSAIISVFLDYLNHYVAAESKNLREYAVDFDANAEKYLQYYSDIVTKTALNMLHNAGMKVDDDQASIAFIGNYKVIVISFISGLSEDSRLLCKSYFFFTPQHTLFLNASYLVRDAAAVAQPIEKIINSVQLPE